MGILNPQFLLNNIDLIGQIISVMILVIFDDFFTEKVTFKSIDWIKAKILEKSQEKFRRRYKVLIKYTFEFMATILFLAYFFIGYWLLSEYFIVPILLRTQAVLLVTLLILFLIMSWILNNKQARKKYLGYD